MKSLLRQNSLKEAQELYNKILERNPFYFDEELDSVLNDQEEYFDESRDGETGYGEKTNLIHLMTSQAWRCLILLLTLSKCFSPRWNLALGHGRSGVSKQELHELYLHLDLDNETLQKI